MQSQKGQLLDAALRNSAMLPSIVDLHAALQYIADAMHHLISIKGKLGSHMLVSSACEVIHQDRPRPKHFPTGPQVPGPFTALSTFSA